MGCDIHAVIEMKHKELGWLHYAPMYELDRDYHLFALLGMTFRNPEVKPMYELRGVPDAVTLASRLHLEKWEGDAHSKSWLSIAEFNEVMNEVYGRLWASGVHGEFRRQAPWFFGNSLNNLVNHPECLSNQDWLEDIRIIFWFDN